MNDINNYFSQQDNIELLEGKIKILQDIIIKLKLELKVKPKYSKGLRARYWLKRKKMGYVISLSDIADECHLSYSWVSNISSMMNKEVRNDNDKI